MTLSCCGAGGVDERRRASVALAIMLAMVMRSSPMLHPSIMSSASSIDALISSSYCGATGTARAPLKGGKDSQEHAACLHCATRRRFGESAGADPIDSDD